MITNVDISLTKNNETIVTNDLENQVQHSVSLFHSKNPPTKLSNSFNSSKFARKAALVSSVIRNRKTESNITFNTSYNNRYTKNKYNRSNSSDLLLYIDLPPPPPLFSEQEPNSFSSSSSSESNLNNQPFTLTHRPRSKSDHSTKHIQTSLNKSLPIMSQNNPNNSNYMSVNTSNELSSDTGIKKNIFYVFCV
jgi:hypothetical protein